MDKIHEEIRHNDAFKSCIYAPLNGIINIITKSTMELKVYRINKVLYALAEWDMDANDWHIIHTGKADDIIEYVNS